jgi:hypothetical protein
MGYQKVNATMKKAEKRISQIIVRQRKGTFFGKEVLRKMCKKSNAGRENRKGLSS